MNDFLKHLHRNSSVGQTPTRNMNLTKAMKVAKRRYYTQVSKERSHKGRQVCYSESDFQASSIISKHHKAFKTLKHP